MALTQGSRQSIPQKLQIPCLYNLFSSMPYMCLHCGTHIFAIKRRKKSQGPTYIIQGRIKLKSFVDCLNQVQKVLNTVAKTIQYNNKTSLVLLSLHTLCSVNDVTEGITQESPMCAS